MEDSPEICRICGTVRYDMHSNNEIDHDLENRESTSVDPMTICEQCYNYFASCVDRDSCKDLSCLIYEEKLENEEKLEKLKNSINKKKPTFSKKIREAVIKRCKL